MDSGQEIPLTWREDYGEALYVPLYYESKSEKSNGNKRVEVTREELAKHNTQESCWFVIHNRVYDGTNFVKNHPGGWLPMKAMAGKVDATDAFEAFHPARVHKQLLPSMFVGWLVAEDQKTKTCPEESKLREEFDERLQIESKDESKDEELVAEEKVEQALREVRQELLKSGAFYCNMSYYWKMIAWILSLFFMGIYLTLDKTYYILGAAAMGICWQQVAFIGHDIGHNAILGKRDRNLFWGVLIGNTFMGISLGWWKQSHNVHHVVCNSVEHDPDIQHMPVFAVNGKLFNEGGFLSTYHKKRFDMDFFARFLVSFQHILFYPVMAVARINLYAQSWINLIVQPHGRVPYRYLEMATLLGFFSWVYLLVSSLDTTEQKWIWIAVSHAVSGILHVQISLSHFAMDIHREGDPDRAKGWFSLQMQTSMNVDTYPLFDWVHGGLQFQVEHHMFPRLPRHRLREARRLVRQALREISAYDRYNEMGFIEGNIYLLKMMRVAAKDAWKLRKGDGGFYASPLYQGINLEG